MTNGESTLGENSASVDRGHASRLRRIDSLTSLRAFGAAAVFVWHANSTHVEGVLGPFFNAAQSGVTFFYLLSGFVLTWAFKPHLGRTAFYGRRFARIYPAHLVTWVIAGFIALIISRVGVLQILSSLLLIQAWIPNSSYYFAPNSVSWSLSCEAFFYAVFPFIVVPILRAAPRTRLVLITGSVAAMAAVQLGTLMAAGPSAIEDEKSFAVWLVYIFPGTRFLEFALGVLVAAEVLSGRSWNIGLRWAVPLAILAYYVSGCFVRSTVGTWVAVIPYLLLMVAVVQQEHRGRVPVLQWRWLIYCGEVSYCFYLTQLVFLSVLQRLVTNYDLPASIKYLDFVIAVVLAVAIHHLVEIPAERRIRGRLAARQELTALAS